MGSFQQKANSYFESLSDHIMLDEGPNIPEEGHIMQRSPIQMALNEQRYPLGLSHTLVDFGVDNVVRPKKIAMDSIHESLILPKLSRTTPLNAFLCLKEETKHKKCDSEYTLCNKTGPSGNLIQIHDEQKSLFEPKSGSPDRFSEWMMSPQQKLHLEANSQCLRALKSFLVCFFTDTPFAEENCVFSNEEAQILGSLFFRKYERNFKDQ